MLKDSVEDNIYKPVDNNYGLINLNEIIDDIFFYMQLKMALKGITPVCDLSEDLSTISGDKVDLTNLFVGMIGQSVEAMKDGGVLCVSTFQGTDHISVIVCDEATDVSDETKRFIYDPTFKVCDITCGETLGIAIMLDIVQKHKGFINISTLKTKGRQFEIFFPIKGERKRRDFETGKTKQFTN